MFDLESTLSKEARREFALFGVGSRNPFANALVAAAGCCSSSYFGCDIDGLVQHADVTHRPARVDATLHETVGDLSRADAG